MYKNCELKIFALCSTKYFGSDTAKSMRAELSKGVDSSFPDGESYARPGEDVRGKDVFVIQSLHNVDNETVDTRLAKLAIFNNAAKYASAARITDVIPYLAYTRQDRKDRSRAPLSAQCVADTLMSSGANRVLSMDWHNPAVQNAYRIPVDILDPIKQLVEYFKNRLSASERIVALAPDVGAAERNEKLSQRLAHSLGREVGFAVGLKKREGDSAKLTDIVGDVDGATILLYDDESVTASTILSAADLARKKGALNGIAVLTHAKFTDSGVSRLDSSELTEVVVTDTVWRPDSFFQAHPKFRKVSVAGLFGEAIRRIHNDESISVLYEE